MKFESLDKRVFILPEGVTGIHNNEDFIFMTWEQINAGCSAAGGVVITLTVDNVNNIIDLDCGALDKKCNKCSNVNTQSEKCLINLHK